MMTHCVKAQVFQYFCQSRLFKRKNGTAQYLFSVGWTQLPPATEAMLSNKGWISPNLVAGTFKSLESFVMINCKHWWHVSALKVTSSTLQAAECFLGDGMCTDWARRQWAGSARQPKLPDLVDKRRKSPQCDVLKRSDIMFKKMTF